MWIPEPRLVEGLGPSDFTVRTQTNVLLVQISDQSIARNEPLLGEARKALALTAKLAMVGQRCGSGDENPGDYQL
jgi:hypothetical protein